jgi:nucleotide-binding universal stress UspA family protein
MIAALKHERSGIKVATARFMAVETTEKPLRIIWAVDPKEAPGSPMHRRVKRLLGHLLAHRAGVVEPVHVLQIGSDLPAAATARWESEYIQAVELATERLIDRLALPDVVDSRVIPLRSLSTRGAVDVLCAHAASVKADLIVTQSHSRTPVNRFFLGSFAESLVSRSRIPVIVVNPRGNDLEGFGRILFATDFGAGASSELSKVLDIAQLFEAGVTLFHAVQGGMAPAVYSSFVGPTVVLPDFREKWLARIQERGDHWIALAAERGVRMNFILDDTGNSPWSQIVRTARSLRAGLIVMQSHTGPVTAALLGSVTRQVIRHSTCPVWVMKVGRRAVGARRRYRKLPRKIPVKRAA